MPIERLKESNQQAVIMAGRLMLAAATTAPQHGGAGVMEGCLVYGDDEIEDIACKLEELSSVKKQWDESFRREANMVRESQAVLFLGCHRSYDPFGGACGRCLGNQGEPKEGTKCVKFRETPKLMDAPFPGPVCSYRISDLGYCVGSALWIAGRLFIDTKPRFPVGLAGMKLGYLPRSKFIVGLPLSVTPKSPFDDVLADPGFTKQYLMDRLERVWPIFRSVYGTLGG
ncbi:MAG: hypothetical protein HQ561_14150 [Desulfobacteraceae bacterium]|nr:hypothetical protein [Desulfobacteraceae bacterium]